MGFLNLKTRAQKAAERDRRITVEGLCEIIKPGYRLFLSGGPATPVHTIRHLAATDHPNLQDIEVIQLTTPTDFESLRAITPSKCRFKTFSIGENSARAMQMGLLDIVPTTIAELPFMFLSGAVEIDVAIVQTSTPDKSGNVSLGTVNDVNRIAIANAAIAIAEINPNVPVTHGDTRMSLSEFDYVIESAEPLLEFSAGPYDGTLDCIGRQIATLVEDGSTVSLSMGRLFDAVAAHLREKKNLKVWTHIVSDWIIGLSESGALASYDAMRRKSPVVTTSCIGTRRLYDFVNGNPNVWLLPLFNSTHQQAMLGIKKLVSVLNVNKIDITGDSVFLSERDLQITGFDSKLNFALAATHSRGGKVIVGLRSTDRQGNSNIVISQPGSPIQNRCMLGSIRYVVTEFGVATIFAKPIRERVLALIEVAHPDHRSRLFEEAKAGGLVFGDQVFVVEHGINYPYALETMAPFKDGLAVKFRAIRPSDEDMMRRLFYQFSDEAKYLRYFTALRTMPHSEMQQYLNVDYISTLSLVGIIQTRGVGRIIAECRYSQFAEENIYEMAFIVDEHYQGRGIARYMLNRLLEIGRERGIERMSAYVLAHNAKMIAVLEKAAVPPRVIDLGEQLRYDYYL